MARKIAKIYNAEHVQAAFVAGHDSFKDGMLDKLDDFAKAFANMDEVSISYDRVQAVSLGRKWYASRAFMRAISDDARVRCKARPDRLLRSVLPTYL